MKFRVWAPDAHTVTLLPEGGQPLALRRERGERGYWSGVAALAAGTRYRFALNTGEALPDPRSAAQPDGVFGPSAVVDHRAFEWHDQRWQPPPIASALIYELHVGTFSAAGTFDGAIPHLDHLVTLGVTHVEIMPVNEFAGTRGWGYDGVLLWAPHHAYGGPAGLKRLVDACHARGLAVLLDVVYNHFGPEGNVMQRYGPYSTDQYKTPWGPAINLDQAGSDEVRRFLCDNALMWLRDYHADGLRLDAIHAFHDNSALPFLEQLAVETDALGAHLGRPLILIAESDLNDPRVIRSRHAGGFGITAQWSDDFHHAVHVTLTGERRGYYQDFTPFRDIARALEHGFVYQGQYSRFRQRSHGRPAGALLSGHQLVSFLQNHDQVGNRAEGTRISQLVSPQRCRAGAALVLTAPFIPLIFQGEEWGASTPFPYFCDHTDPALIEAVRAGRRAEFADQYADATAIPDPESAETFASARLCWPEVATGDHATTLAWYRTLIALRRAQPDLTDGRLDRCSARYNETAGWLAVRRGTIQLLCNLGTEAQSMPVDRPIEPRAILAESGDVMTTAGTVRLGPDAVLIFQTSAEAGP